MRYLTHSFQIVFALLFLSCDGKSKTANSVMIVESPKRFKYEKLPSFAGTSYFFAPEFDSISNCAIGFCDCCSWNIYFIDSANFLMEDYCIDGDSYCYGSYGSYIQHADTLILTSGNKTILTSKADEFEGTEQTIELLNCKPSTSKWKIGQHKGKIVLSHLTGNQYFGTCDSIQVATKMIQFEKEGILQLLKSK